MQTNVNMFFNKQYKPVKPSLYIVLHSGELVMNYLFYLPSYVQIQE